MTQHFYVSFVFLPTLGVLGFLYYHRVKTFKFFSKIESQTISGGYEAAKMVLDGLQFFDIHIEKGKTNSPSQYLLQKKVISLSPFDYESRSFAAIGKAQHQVGHVIQHMKGRSLLLAKAFLYPSVRVGGILSVPMVVASLVSPFRFLYPLGAFLFTFYVLFVFFIFPLEVNASREVYNGLIESNFFPSTELDLIRRVLQAASLGNLTGLFDFFGRIGKKHVS